VLAPQFATYDFVGLQLLLAFLLDPSRLRESRIVTCKDD
jgi:hypothetical protein